VLVVGAGGGGLGPNPQTPNPQSPIPNPQSPMHIRNYNFYILIKFQINEINIKRNLKINFNGK